MVEEFEATTQKVSHRERKLDRFPLSVDILPQGPVKPIPKNYYFIFELHRQIFYVKLTEAGKKCCWSIRTEEIIYILNVSQFSFFNLQELGCSAKGMRLAIGKDYHDFKLLNESKKCLKTEGFFKSAKVVLY